MMTVWLRSEPRRASLYTDFHRLLPEQTSFGEVKMGTSGVLLVQQDVTDSCLTALSMDQLLEAQLVTWEIRAPPSLLALDS